MRQLFFEKSHAQNLERKNNTKTIRSSFENGRLQLNSRKLKYYYLWFYLIQCFVYFSKLLRLLLLGLSWARKGFKFAPYINTRLSFAKQEHKCSTCNMTIKYSFYTRDSMINIRIPGRTNLKYFF